MFVGFGYFALRLTGVSPQLESWLRILRPDEKGLCLSAFLPMVVLVLVAAPDSPVTLDERPFDAPKGAAQPTNAPRGGETRRRQAHLSSFC